MDLNDAKTDLIAFILECQKLERDVIFEWAAGRLSTFEYMDYMDQIQFSRARAHLLALMAGIC